MENEIQLFDNDNFNAHIRALTIDGSVWFVGKDVAAALGYGTGKSLANAVANHVDDEDKGVTEMMTPGGKQQMVIINESGLYSLVLSSKLPTAKAFKRWITAEVLPSIRRTGSYSMLPDFTDPVIAARAWADEVEAKQQAQAQLAIAQQENEHSREVLGIKDGWGSSCKEICNTHLSRKITYLALIKMMRTDGLFQSTKELYPAQKLIDLGIMMMVPEKWGHGAQGTSLTAKFVTTSIPVVLPYFNACVACVQPMESVKRAQHAFDVAARKYMRVTSTQAKAKALEERKEAKEILETAQEELELAVQARQDIAVDLLAGNLTPAAA